MLFNFYAPFNYLTCCLSYADWTGLRPMSELECYKALYGPLPPQGASFDLPGKYIAVTDYDIRYYATYFGMNDAIPSIYQNNPFFAASEPMINLTNHSFVTVNGNGNLLQGGFHDVDNWNNITSDHLSFYDIHGYNPSFRYVRSAE